MKLYSNSTNGLFINRNIIEFDSIDSLRQILFRSWMDLFNCINVMLFSLLHWPCATTLFTIKKETGSVKWTVLAAVIPTGIAFVVCFITASVARILGIG